MQTWPKMEGRKKRRKDGRIKRIPRFAASVLHHMEGEGPYSHLVMIVIARVVVIVAVILAATSSQ